MLVSLCAELRHKKLHRAVLKAPRATVTSLHGSRGSIHWTIAGKRLAEGDLLIIYANAPINENVECWEGDT